MNTELNQQLSNLLDELPSDTDLNNLLQTLHQNKNMRDLYSRYLLIGTVMRGEMIHVASLNVSEKIRHNLFNTKPIIKTQSFNLIRWFTYTNVWNLAVTTVMLIIIIGLYNFNSLRQSSMPQTFLSYTRHFWPGVITLNKDNHLTMYAATMQHVHHNNYLEITSQLQPNQTKNSWYKNINNDIITVNAKLPTRYNNVDTLHR